MPSPRTTARGFALLALLLLTLTAGASAARPKKIVFPVLGTVSFYDDFGEARAGGAHQGIDIVAPKRSPALAAEAGKIEFWSRSATAGCMLYLHGQSGTDYYYIHLNNDRTMRNDNRGKCVAGTAYAKGLRDGAKVAAGQPIGYVGDSGDANGIHPHLHFELHPAAKGAVDPYPWLQRASRLLFAAPRGVKVTLALRGTVASVTESSIRIKLGALTAFPMRQHLAQLNRRLVVNVPAGATIQTEKGNGITIPATLATAKPGQQVRLMTSPARASLKNQRGDDLALNAALVSLVSP
jgi:hypothetical protein